MLLFLAHLSAVFIVTPFVTCSTGVAIATGDEAWLLSILPCAEYRRWLACCRFRCCVFASEQHSHVPRTVLPTTLCAHGEQPAGAAPAACLAGCVRCLGARFHLALRVQAVVRIECDWHGSV
jgi:hypothetical protein